MVVYGVPGVGKSTFASKLPRPLFIQCEDGLAGIDAPAFPLAESLGDVMGQLAAVLNDTDGEYSSVVIDTADALERLIFAKVAADSEVKHIEDLGYGKGYTFALAYWSQILDMLNAIRNKGIIVCVLCHDNVKKFQSPITDSYDRYDLALHAKASGLLVGWCDILGFANWQVMTKTEDAGFNKKNNKGIGTGKRRLFLEERPAFLAKNRYSLPPEIEFSWSVLADLINPTTKEQ